MHPGDRQVAMGECWGFLRSLWHSMAPNAFWVNSVDSYAGANAKARQLGLARQCGFQIPETLITNDPAAVRSFLRSHGEVIYKTFAPWQWNGDGRRAISWANVVTESDLPDDETLALTPGIFQPRVAKAYEVRVTAVGRRCFAARLDSQLDERHSVDWRTGGIDVPVRAAELPAAVARSCHRLMDALGIVFGCFDFIVTAAGEYIFWRSTRPASGFGWSRGQPSYPCCTPLPRC